MMNVKQAKEIARQWVVEQASTISGFQGAFFHGSINGLPDDTLLPATSDVDVVVVLADPHPPGKTGKFIYHDLLLDVSFLSAHQLQSPEQVLGQYAIAGSFRSPGIILDPSGQLTELQAVVSQNFAKRQWVVKRCEDARNKVLRHLDSANPTDPFHDQVIGWVFATGVTTHILLVAGLKNPTVRQRYRATRELLADYGYLDFYETLLAMLGCARMSRQRVKHHLAALAEAFDVAVDVIETPFPFASDISASGRPVAIDGSRDLIQRGDYREAIFWVVVTFSRCQAVLYHDAPVELQNKFSPDYRHLLDDLGILSPADLQRRSEQLRHFLPRVWEVAEAIIAANPEIDD
jgi:hypothetical protein